MIPNAPTELLVVGLLREARNLGVAPILRTVLHKLVYLADVYSAEETNGKTFTSESWRFLHFGPYSVGVAETMDRLASRGLVEAEIREHARTDAEFILYSPRDIHGAGLREIGLPSGVALQLSSDLQKYARPGQLSALLNYVYFHTSPMNDARPGATLAFDMCETTPISAYRPIEISKLSGKALEAARGRLHETYLKSKTQSGALLTFGPYDAIYLQALDYFDGESLSTGLQGKAELVTD